jgi:hypothetical protein
MSSSNSDDLTHRRAERGTEEKYDEKAESTGVQIPQNQIVDPDRNASVTSRRARGSVVEATRRNVNAKLANPLAGMSIEELREEGREYAKFHGIVEEEDMRAFELGAILAQRPEKYDRVKEYSSEEEMQRLDREYTHKFSHPGLLYLVIILCSTCAAVQGMVSSPTL